MLRNRSGYMPLLVLVLFSLTLKLFLMFQVEVVNVDGARYLVAVNRLLEGDFMLSLKLSNSPLYLAFIVLFKALTGDAVLAGLLLSTLSSAFLVVPLYLVILRLADHPAAFWGSAALVLSPWYNEYSHEIVRGPLFLFLFMWGLWFALRALDSQRTRDFFCCGIFVFLACMIRIEGVIFYPFFLIYLAISAYRQVGFKTSLVHTTSFLLILIIGLMGFFGYTGLNPLSVQSTVHLTDFSSSEFLGTYQHIYAQLHQIEESFPDELGGGRSYNIIALARHYMPLLYFVGIFEAVGKILFPLFVLPLILGFKHAGKLARHHKLLVMLAVGYFAMAFLLIVYKNWISHRYVQVLPLLLYPLIGVGFVALLEHRARPIAGKLLCLFLVMCFVIPIYKSYLTVANQNVIVRQAGEWIGDQKNLINRSLYASDGRIPFYAGRERDYINFGRKLSKQQIFDSAKHQKMDLVVIEVSLAETRLLTSPDYDLLKEFAGEKRATQIFIKKGIMN